MLKTFACMLRTCSGRPILSSWQYALAKRAARESQIGNPSKFRGRTHTDETKKLLSEKKRGKPSPNRGKIMSDEQKAKISSANTGKSPSTEARAAIGARMKGNTYRLGQSPTEETKEKLRIASLGNKSTTGMKDGDETRLRKSIAHSDTMKPQSNNSLGLRGVTRHQGKYRTRTKVGGHLIELGVFDCPAAAHLQYIVAVEKARATIA